MAGDPADWELAEFWPAYGREERIGHASTMIWSPRLERNIGYVWVPIDLAEPGIELEIEPVPGVRRAARTAKLPFVDPGKRTPAA